MDRYDERFCRKCGSSSESLKYQIPPHSAKTGTKFCPDCGAIKPNAPRKSTKDIPPAMFDTEYDPMHEGPYIDGTEVGKYL